MVAVVGRIASLILVGLVSVLSFEVFFYCIHKHVIHFVIVLLNGKDSGLGRRPQGPIFFLQEPLGFGRELGAFSHSGVLFLHDFVAEFCRQEIDQEGHADLVEHVVMDKLVSVVDHGITVISAVRHNVWGNLVCAKTILKVSRMSAVKAWRFLKVSVL